MYDTPKRRNPARRLRRLLERQAVQLSRSIEPKRQPRPRPLQGDQLRRLKRLETALYIRTKRRKPVARKPRRIDMAEWTLADVLHFEQVARSTWQRAPS